jgi:hypothetical protein
MCSFGGTRIDMISGIFIVDWKHLEHRRDTLEYDNGSTVQSPIVNHFS